MNNSKAWTVLKALCIYYALQLLILHIYLFLNLQSIQGKPDPIINETIHRVTKTVMKNETREFLTAEQVDRIEKEINAFEPIQKMNYTNIMLQIQDNLSQIVAQRVQLEEDLNGIEEYLKELLDPAASSQSKDREMIVPQMNQLIRMLQLDTYEQESDVNISALHRDIKEELSAIAPDQSYDFAYMFQVSKKSDFDCSSFLNRLRKVRGSYVTMEELDNYMDGLREELKRVQKEPLSLNDKEIILNHIDFEATVGEAKRNIENQMVELMDTVDAWGDEIDDSCIAKEEVEHVIEVGMQSLISQEKLYASMQDALEDLGSESTLDRFFVGDDKSDDENQITFWSLIETPLYPKLIESIDSFVDLIAGYNDFVDKVIDKIGEAEDGRVGRVLEKYVNRFNRMIQIPRQHE